MMYSELYLKITDSIAAGRKAVLLTKFPKDAEFDGIPEKILYTEDMTPSARLGSSMEQELAAAALREGAFKLKTEKEHVYFAEPYFPEARMVILGGGHIALPLVEFAAKCGFHVTVVDDRPSFANRQRFPLAKEVLCESFERCFDKLSINRAAFVVVITRGHRHDLDCLRHVLKCETAYTGMIGSRRRVRAAREQLLEEGYPKEKLDAVQAPIGLDIGAETPEEIAVSILAQVIKYKRADGNTGWPEVCLDVLGELVKGGTEQRALATIIETKGSVPRETGAKMIVWPQGRTLGSIGGGCSESAVIASARDIIRDGGCRVVSVDMTADAAEEEGMVCGGTMKVLLERC